MKVKCIKIYNSHRKKFEATSPWITIGKEYIVLEVSVNPGREIYYRLVGDNLDESPGLYDAIQFEVTSNKIPSTWKIRQSSNVELDLGPEPWQIRGFWEDCYNSDSKSLEIYRREARIIYEEENGL